MYNNTSLIVNLLRRVVVRYPHPGNERQLCVGDWLKVKTPNRLK